MNPKKHKHSQKEICHVSPQFHQGGLYSKQLRDKEKKERLRLDSDNDSIPSDKSSTSSLKSSINDNSNFSSRSDKEESPGPIINLTREEPMGFKDATELRDKSIGDAITSKMSRFKNLGKDSQQRG